MRGTGDSPFVTFHLHFSTFLPTLPRVDSPTLFVASSRSEIKSSSKTYDFHFHLPPHLLPRFLASMANPLMRNPTTLPVDPSTHAIYCLLCGLSSRSFAETCRACGTIFISPSGGNFELVTPVLKRTWRSHNLARWGGSQIGGTDLSDHPTPPSNTKSFPRFRYLPMEVRIMIWKAALPGPRVVFIQAKRLRDVPCSRVRSDMCVEDTSFFDNGYPTRVSRYGYKSQSSIPMLYVCQESFAGT